MDDTPTTAERTEPLDALDLPRCNLAQRSVNITRRRANGFVEFEFSVGWPELVVELMMTEADFQQFCQKQNIPLPQPT